MGTTTLKPNIIEFLEREYIVPEGTRSGELIDFSEWGWQEQVLSELMEIKETDGKRQYTASVISTPRQQGKSLLLQCIGAFFLFGGGQNLNIYSIACDRDQAALVPDRVKRAIELNPRLSSISKATRNEIICPTNGNKWTILTSDKASAPGISADVLLWDELAMLPEHQWNLFYLLLPTTSARENPLWVIASTVGASEEGPLHDFMKIGRDEEEVRTHLYETTEIKSPLTNQEQVERDRKLMPEAVFARHYQNLVMRGASFISDEDIAAMIRPTSERGRVEALGAHVGCDWGLTKDKCAITNILALENQDFIFDKCYVFHGSKSEPVDLNDAAETAESLYEPGWTISMLFDKWQAMSTIQRLQKKWGDDAIQGFDFTNTSRKRLFKNIFTVIRDQRLMVFSDILNECWKQSCATCQYNLSCEECNAHDFLRELQGLECDSDFNVSHGKRGDDITVSTALALFYAVQDEGSVSAIWLLGGDNG